MAMHIFGGPRQRGQRRHIGCVGGAVHAQFAAGEIDNGRDVLPRRAPCREPREDLFALAKDGHVCLQLSQCGAGGCRGVWPYHGDDGRLAIVQRSPQGAERLLRDAKFGRRAAPEQVTRRRGDHDAIRLERPHAAGEILVIDLV